MYICSYMPTLGALIQSRGFPSPEPDPQDSLLLVAKPDEHIPDMRAEMEVIQRLPIPVTTLSSADATQAAVAESLQSHTLVHFTCQGTQGTEEPVSLDAANRLYRITLRDIANSRLPPTEFAFLSACHIEEPTDTGNPTEGLKIAAAMQHHGFGSVVGTMWEMAYPDGKLVSKLFYQRLLAGGGGSRHASLGERSARELRDAVQKLRGDGSAVDRWVNWVHYGA
ncbi:hypothetical protein H4582DRAFT_2076391 [Lactarius indigo]|nr:hypothetical protein H4582DRAFT_2076391 [Lactarius indigo]